MKKRGSRRWLYAPFTLIALSALLSYHLYSIRGGFLKVIFIHTNDLHGIVHPAREAVGEEIVKKGGVGGLYQMILVERERAKKRGQELILLDSGDFFVGTPEGDLTSGKMIIEIMNELGYDAVTLGNHDFDLGVSGIRELSRVAAFPFLSANMIYKKGGSTPFTLPFRAFDLSGIKIVVTGFTATPNNFVIDGEGAEVEFLEPGPVLSRLLKDIFREGEKVVPVILSHMGLEEDRLLAATFQSIPLFLSGHNHQGLGKGERVGRTLIFQTWGKCCCIDRVEMKIRKRDGKVIRLRGRLIELSPLPVEETPLMAILERYSSIIDEKAGVVLGIMEENLPIKKGDFGSSAAGSFVTDVMRDHMDADIAIHNKTGLRNDFLKGGVRIRDVYEVLPFYNHLVKLKMKGEDIVELLEYALSDTHYAVEISGMKVFYDPKKEPGRRVERVVVDGNELGAGREYTVVTNSYLAKGGSGYIHFTRGEVLSSGGELVRDVVSSYIGEKGRIRYDFSERFIEKE